MGGWFGRPPLGAIMGRGSVGSPFVAATGICDVGLDVSRCRLRAALPLVLRDDAGGLEAQGHGLAEGGAANRAAWDSVPRALPNPAAGARAAGRHLRLV